MSAGAILRESGIVVHDASWQTYVELRDAAENSHVRMTYDRGSLELMSPSKSHERIGYLIGRFIDIWTMVKCIPIQSCRTTTFRRKDLRRGLEPDNCYYIEHEAIVREREEVDLTIDPPPDLAVEVDVTSKSIKRLPIYAALGVPEVWHWRAENLRVLRLKAKKTYAEAAGSQSLPGFPHGRMVALIRQRNAVDDTTMLREFHRLCRGKKKKPSE